MEDKVLHAIDIKKVSTNALIGVVLGGILTFVNASTIVNLMVVFVGLLIIVINGTNLYTKMQTKEETSNETLLDVLGILAGFMLLVMGNFIVNILVAIYLIIEPIVELALVKFKKDEIMIRAPKIIFGIVLLICSIGVFDILFRIVGVIILVVSIGYLGYNYYLYKKSGVKIIK